MTKKPILVFTGLAVAAVAGVAGLTRDQWMGDVPSQIAGAEVSKSPAVQPPAEQPAATAEVPAASVEKTPVAETPAAEAPAAAEAEQQTAAVQPQVAAPAPETPVPEAAAPAAATSEAAAPEAAAPEATTPAAAAPETPAPAAAEAGKSDVPAFDTVRIEKSGEAVIAGTAEAGSEVVVKLDGEEIGKTVANSDGAFVVVPEAPLPSGSGALTIESKGEGDAAPTASEETVAVIVPASEEKQESLVAIVSPNAPTKVLQKPGAEEEAETQVALADPATEAPAEPAAAAPAAEQPAAAAPAAKPAQLVSIDSVDYDETGNIVFSGRGEPGNGARIYVDNNFVGDAPVAADGRWSFAGTAEVKTGVHALRVDGVDAKGTVINRVEVPFFREETKKVVASAPPAEPVADQTVAKTEPEPAPAAPAATAAPAAETAAPTEPAANAEPEQQTAAASGTDQPEAAAPAAPKEGRVVIQPGNNLWRISRVLYGSGMKYTLLYQANKDQIRDPDKIYPGQIFKTPDVSPKVENIDPDRRDPLTPEENAASGQ